MRYNISKKSEFLLKAYDGLKGEIHRFYILKSVYELYSVWCFFFSFSSLEMKNLQVLWLRV